MFPVLLGSVLAFLVIISFLVGVLLYAKTKLVAAGEVKLFINGEKDEPMIVSPGSTLLSVLSEKNVFLPSACGGGGTCAMCLCQIDEGGGDVGHAFLQRPAAEALVRANEWLHMQGYGLLVHDGYRPWYVTKMFWEATPEPLRIFVADPASGSRHNRGCAVDLTLFDLETGEPIEMTGGYDEMSPRSFPNYPGGTTRQRWHRELLRAAMEVQGFAVYEAEWWHFDYKDWRRYCIGNERFEAIGGGA